MAAIGLRITTFLTNSIVLLAFIYLYDWLQMDEKNAWTAKYRNPLLIGITSTFLIFFHASSLLSIMNQEHAIGYGWTFLNFQIITIYYALLSTRAKSMLIAMVALVGTWLFWMPPFPHWITLSVLTVVFFYFLQRYLRLVAKNIFIYYGIGFVLAAPLFLTNYFGLRGIDVGWSWQISTYFLLMTVMWMVNRQLTSHSEHEIELLHDATIDDLTQLANFRSFDADLHTAFDRYRATGELYALYTFDIDHFKYINDKYGHLAGNEVLRIVAARLRDITAGLEYRAGTYRTGGEEFSVLLFDVVENVERAKEISREIQAELAKLHFAFNDDEPFSITISLGQDRATPDDKNYLDIYKRADQFLYSSKHHGRDALTIRGVTLAK